MFKKIAVSIFFLFFLIFISSSFYFLIYSQTVTVSQSKVIYEMPYPGILPDHPLYFLKICRDRILEFATRDYIKKSELYLLYSDKRTAMAINLVKKGKEKLALTTLSKAEKYFFKIPFLLKESKKQGVNPPDELVNKLKLSNAKHKEIIEGFFKDLPQEQTDLISGILKINGETKKELDTL